LANVDRAEVGMDTRVIGCEALRFVQARLGGGEIARLHLMERALHTLGRTTRRHTMAFLVAFAAAAGTRRVARRGRHIGQFGAHGLEARYSVQMRCMASSKSRA